MIYFIIILIAIIGIFTAPLYDGYARVKIKKDE